VPEELSWPPLTHLLVHQKLADALLLGETSNQLSFYSLITASGWGLVMKSCTSAAYLLSRCEIT